VTAPALPALPALAPVLLPQPDGLPPRWLCLVCRGLDGLHEPGCPLKPAPAPARALPALVLAGVLAVAAALATGPTPITTGHHPAEQSGTERALGRVAAALALRWSFPR